MKEDKKNLHLKDKAILYHYCSTSSFLSIIKTKSIRLSLLTLSNDSMEGKVLSNLLYKLLKEEGLSEDIKMYKIIKHVITSLENVFYGLGFCLSEDGDLLSQWRGYADDGKGFSIGFSKQYLELLKDNLPDNKPGYQMYKVVYNQVEQQRIVKPIFDGIKSAIKSEKLNYPSPSLLSMFSNKDTQKNEIDEHKKAYYKLMMNIFINSISNIFVLKNGAFTEEKEWRLISYLRKDEDGNSSDYYSGKNKIIPCRNFSFIPLGLEPISEIIIGPKNITPEFVIEGLLDKYGYKDVKIKRSKIPYI